MSYLVIFVEEIPIRSVVGAGISQNNLDTKNKIRRQERIATAFQERMTDGQKFEGTGQYRQEFFEEVIDRAKDVRSFIGFVVVSVLMGFRKAIHIENGTEQKRLSSFRLPRPYLNTGPRQAGAKLTSFICPPKGFCRENRLQRPIVILAFDEAHQLADHVYGQNWTLLSELRRVLLHETHWGAHFRLIPFHGSGQTQTERYPGSTSYRGDKFRCSGFHSRGRGYYAR